VSHTHTHTHTDEDTSTALTVGNQRNTFGPSVRRVCVNNVSYKTCVVTFIHVCGHQTLDLIENRQV